MISVASSYRTFSAHPYMDAWRNFAFANFQPGQWDVDGAKSFTMGYINPRVKYPGENYTFDHACFTAGQDLAQSHRRAMIYVKAMRQVNDNQIAKAKRLFDRMQREKAAIVIVRDDRATAVEKVDPFTGKVVGTYRTIKDAAAAHNVTKSCISQAIKRHRRSNSQAGAALGFFWREG